ncbi:hypothetical protein, partial [Chryseobacterium luteum]|uniref:hypothetical protein n=1 Tax=Chryseobacterium luteum TaxID=421531 RepID=UPI001E2AC0DD
VAVTYKLYWPDSESAILDPSQPKPIIPIFFIIPDIWFKLSFSALLIESYNCQAKLTIYFCT